MKFIPCQPSIWCRTYKKFKFFNGLHGVNHFWSNGFSSDLALIRLSGKSSLTIRDNGRIRATMISGEGGLLSYSNGNNVAAVSDDQSVGIEIQPDAVAFGTLGADTAPIASFPTDNDEVDLDCPSGGFSSIPEAIEDIRQGKVCCFSCFSCYVFNYFFSAFINF